MIKYNDILYRYPYHIESQMDCQARVFMILRDSHNVRIKKARTVPCFFDNGSG